MTRLVPLLEFVPPKACVGNVITMMAWAYYCSGFLIKRCVWPSFVSLWSFLCSFTMGWYSKKAQLYPNPCSVGCIEEGTVRTCSSPEKNLPMLITILIFQLLGLLLMLDCYVILCARSVWFQICICNWKQPRYHHNTMAGYQRVSSCELLVWYYRLSHFPNLTIC